MTLAFTPPASLVPGLYPQDTGSFFAPNQLLTNGSNPGSADNPDINLQVTIEEQHHDEMEIQDHPVEIGAPITDHTFKRPAELTLHVGWTNRQLLALASGSSSDQYLNALAQVYSQLLQGQANRVLYTVNTTKRVYQDMMIKGISTVTDEKTRNVLLVTVIIRQVILVSTSIVAASAAQRNQLNPMKTNATINLAQQNLRSGSTFKSSSIRGGQ